MQTRSEQIESGRRLEQVVRKQTRTEHQIRYRSQEADSNRTSEHRVIDADKNRKDQIELGSRQVQNRTDRVRKQTRRENQIVRKQTRRECQNRWLGSRLEENGRTDPATKQVGTERQKRLSPDADSNEIPEQITN